MNRLEILSLAGALLLFLFVPSGAGRRVRALSRTFARMANRRWLAIVFVAVLTASSSALLSLFVFQPEPLIHDEFSYLLAADTFAHGRVTNAPHPLWIHFETFHIIQQPTYASKYPPAQGLLLALGQVLTGSPLVGVWIGMGLCCGAICWMLQGWLPPRWALCGALLASGRLVLLGAGVTSIGYWSQSYWGGAVAACGGALLFGALRRLLRRPQVSSALLMGLGLAILANSRPFEGMIASIPAALVVLAWLASRKRPTASVAICKVLLPVGVVLGLTAAAMGYYNYRVTGHPLLMPYQVHESSYGFVPFFVCQSLKPEPSYNHWPVHDFYVGWVCDLYLKQRSLGGWLEGFNQKLEILWSFFLSIILAAPLIALRWALRDRWVVFALLTCGLLLAFMMLMIGVVPHYAAPVTGLIYFIVTQSLRQLRLFRWGDRCVGKVFVNALLVSYAVLILLAVPLETPTLETTDWFRQRARLLAELRQSPDRHLVIVRYGPNHNVHAEWVYNEADIDRAQVVWAREMDADHNRKLIDYFRDRRQWLLEADNIKPALVPYSAPHAPKALNSDNRGSRLHHQLLHFHGENPTNPAKMN